MLILSWCEQYRLSVTGTETKQQTLEDIKKMLKIPLNYPNILCKDHLKSFDAFAQYSHVQKKMFCFISKAAYWMSFFVESQG